MHLGIGNNFPKRCKNSEIRNDKCINSRILDIRKKAIEMGVSMVIESEGLDPTGLEEVKRCIDFLKAVDESEK